VSGAGTGGTIAGTSVYLKGVQPDLQVVLADPEGSGLYNKVRFMYSKASRVVDTSQVKEGVMYHPRESEGRRRRHQVDTVVEGMQVAPPNNLNMP
jgi:cysteine synthase A